MTSHAMGVFLYEIKRNFRRRGYLFSTFGLPLIGLALYFAIQVLSGSSADPRDQLAEFEFDLEASDVVGYVDLSNTFEAPGEDSPLAGAVIAYPDESGADTALNAGEIDLYYVISEDYLETGDVQLVMPRFAISQVTSTPLDNLFYNQLIDDVDLTTLSLLANPAFIEEVRLERPGAEEVVDEGVSNTLTQVFAIVMVIALLSTNGYLMQSIIEEKESQLIEVLISSVRPLQLLTGKILALGTLGLLQVVAYIAILGLASTIVTDSGGFLSDLQFDADVLAMALIYFVIGYLLFAAMFGAVGALSSSVTEAPNIAFIFIFPAMMPWVFASQIASDPGGGLAVGMSMFPLTSPLAMVMRISVSSVPLTEIVISLAILMVSVLLMLTFASRLFRVQILLAGKRPHLSEIPRLVLG